MNNWAQACPHVSRYISTFHFPILFLDCYTRSIDWACRLMIQPEIEKLKIKHLMMIIIIMNAMTWHAMGVWQIRGQLVLRCRSLGYMLTFLYKSKNKWKIINFMHTSNCTTSYHPYYLRIEEVVCLQKEKKIPKKKKKKKGHMCVEKMTLSLTIFIFFRRFHTHTIT